MNKNYYAIIPASIRYDPDLAPNAKLLYGEITALSNEKGYCWASNEYFSDLYNVSKQSISNWIKQLCEKGHIESRLVYKEGTKEILNRYITILVDPTQNFFGTPTQKKLKDNNTVINNTDNTTSYQDTGPVSPSKNDLFDEFIQLFNGLVGRQYKGDSKAMKQFSARLAQKYTLADFEKAIRNALQDAHHADSNFKWFTPEFITRADRLEYFINFIPARRRDDSPAADFNEAADNIKGQINSITSESYDTIAERYRESTRYKAG